MSPTAAFARPPGFYDRTAQESAEATALTAVLQGLMARFGYQTVETPILEYADLFLSKSGDEAVNRLFSFEMYGRLLCLRSEFTPSAARLYVERFQHEPKPIRWQFAGPVFRYETQRSQSRQFTMLGCELIGPSGVGGDAETMGLAAQGLLHAGLRDWTLHVGHVGLIGQATDRFGLDRRLRRFVLGQVENLRRADRGRAYVDEQIARLYAGLPAAVDAGQADSADGLNIGQALRLVLQSADLGSAGSSRTSEDIARRLVSKGQRATQRDAIAAALDFLEQLTAIEGAPDVAFPALEALLPDDPGVRDTFHAFRAAVDLLPAYGVEAGRVQVHMGLARGLNYYTGIVFELYSNGVQLGGGGRYDELIRVLGAAQDTPAVGFAYRLERILAELRRDGFTVPAESVQALVVPLDEADDAEAARVAMALRANASVELYAPPTRNLSQVLARASKRGTPYVVIVGAEERAHGQVTVRDMRAGSQFACATADLAALLAGENGERTAS
ncbi:MAG: histidine--tRNA ligase family protein [Anaerolineae bacterium]|nr:histidine--tRNA ligase family protein [Anaerolineae bacterium]